MSQSYVPIPLFDTIEFLHTTCESQWVIIQPQLPSAVNSTHVLADYKQACQFLHAYRGSMETFKSYRREIERLLQWAWFIQNKTLKDLRRNDLEHFLEFCQAPPKEWIGIKHVSR